MAYRIHARFKDGSASGPLTDVVAANPPRCGDTICVTRDGENIPVKVTAVLAPSPGLQNRAVGLVMVEAQEI